MDNASDQSTNEAAYTGYLRVAVARDPVSPKWTVATPNVSNANQITFPTAGSGETELYWGVGTDSAGAGHLIYGGPITNKFYGFTAETTGNISVPGSSFAPDDRIAFFPLWSDYIFPTGITAGTLYYVLTASGDVITISTSSGGSPVTISAAGAGECAIVVPFVVVGGNTPAILANQAVILAV